MGMRLPAPGIFFLILNDASDNVACTMGTFQTARAVNSSLGREARACDPTPSKTI